MLPPQFAELSVLDLVPFGRESAARTFALRLSPPPWSEYAPGQFVMLRPADWGPELPWARPFSISRSGKYDLVCFIQVAGRGTQRLAELKAGDAVHTWGPLGNGFAVEADSPTLLLAGGVGIAPFIGYAQQHPKPWNVSLLFGHRAPRDCYPLDSINERIDVAAMHEESPADLERFTAAVRARMEEHAEHNGLALACGPLPMLRTVQALAAQTGLRAQLSLESRMACGVGACLGCVVTTTDAWPVPERKNWPVQTCNCGPVFWAGHVTL
jgi:dihydroorotate dehydrogenase electron transfer subunit